MDHYDSGKMRSCASDIENELKNYKAAREDVESIVEHLRSNWQDSTNENYSKKYNAEAKVAAQNVETLMRKFAEVLNSTADAFDEIHKKANNDIG